MKKLTTQDFVARCKIIHGDKYDYSLVAYTGSHSKVTLICPQHGEIKILPFNHLNNKRGCKKCGLEKTHNENKVTLKEFICRCDKLKEYEYKDINFSKLTDKIVLICKFHGEFTTSPRNLLRNCGCPKCKREKSRLSFDEFVERANLVHNNKYDYSNSKYITSHTDININCPDHGLFTVKPYWHLDGGKCPKCSSFISLQEIEVAKFLREIGIEVIQPFRDIKHTKEIDMFCPLYSIGIEYNGLYWHSDKFKDTNYHYNKTKLAASQGIRLIHIFDDEWQLKKDICKSRLLSIFNKLNKIWARKTVIKEVSSKDASNFLTNNHLQGNVFSKYRVGLYLHDELVSLMTFGNYRKNLGRNSKDNCFELLRFCNKNYTTVVGGASKLFNWFIKKYKPYEIISYSDIRWSVGNLYEKLGFKFIKNTKPNYFYTDGSLKRHNRFKYRKNVLVKLGYDKSLSEKEITNEIGLYRVYDCGNKLYVYKAEDIF